jgi:hypothetical protein
MIKTIIPWCRTLTYGWVGAALVLSPCACGSSAGTTSSPLDVASVSPESGIPAESANQSDSSPPSSQSNTAFDASAPGAEAPDSGALDNPAPDAGAGSSAPLCGTTPCDLRTNTCCLPTDGGVSGAECKPGASAMCSAGTATFHCQQMSDCAKGDVCCGVYDLSAGTAQTQCQSGSCQIAQFCKTNAECRNGQSCTEQLCQGQAMLQLCGVQAALGCSAR